MTYKKSYDFNTHARYLYLRGEKSKAKNEVFRLVFRRLSLSFFAAYQVFFPVVDS